MVGYPLPKKEKKKKVLSFVHGSIFLLPIDKDEEFEY